MSRTDPIFQFLKECFGQRSTITIPRALVQLTGELKTALVLSQIIFWHDKTSNEEGWFYKTYEEWQEETGLSKNEVSGAVDRLKPHGIVETELRKVGQTPKLHYRFSETEFRGWISRSTSENQKSPTSENQNPTSENQKSRTSENQKSYLIAQKNTTEEYIQNTPPTPSRGNECSAAPSEEENPERQLDLEPEAPPKMRESNFPPRKRWSQGRRKEPRKLGLQAQIQEEMRMAGISSTTARELANLPACERGGAITHAETEKTAPSAPQGPCRQFSDLIPRWNELVPQRPMDPTLYSNGHRPRVVPRALQDPIFHERFEEICQKAAKFLEKRPDADWFDLVWLMRYDEDTQIGHWQKLLENRYSNWKKNAKHPQDVELPEFQRPE